MSQLAYKNSLAIVRKDITNAWQEKYNDKSRGTQSQLANWLNERNITLEASFVESIHTLASEHSLKLGELYRQIGCNKTDICRWKDNPCSTHATAKQAKLSVVRKATVLLNLSPQAEEKLASKAGLSFCEQPGALKELLKCSAYHPCQSVVSERMLQYYSLGEKLPTKQALLAIALSFELSCEEIVILLRSYGFSLSSSLPNDAIVLWFLKNNPPSLFLLYSINEVLEELNLPILMTKQIKFLGCR